MDATRKIQELTDLLNEASNAYYNTGSTIMEDFEFDLLMKELCELEAKTGIILSNSPTHKVGAKVVGNINKISHERPMLSLDKCHSEQELIDFAGTHNCYLSVKCDGLSTRLIYQGGELIAAATRGDGNVGQDVLFHVKEYLNVPMTIPYKDSLVIDGESVILYQDFEKINEALPENKKFKNARNLASGTLANLDANITKQRNMRFIAWRVIEGLDGNSNFFKLKEAEKLGFTIVPIWTYGCSADKDHISDMLHHLRQQANNMGLPMDGAVMAKDSISLSESMGRTDKFFRHSIAYKYEDDVYESRLEYVDWTLGRSGVLTPTAVFNPVIIDGTEVARASVHNLTIMKELNLTNHCTVNVFKANCIIPQIDSCENDGNGEIEIPSVCPVCGGATAINKDNESEVLICTNPNCYGKLLAKLAHFVSRKRMNIDGLSEATLEKLISLGYINSFHDIYGLSNHYDQLIELDGLGQKSVEKLLLAIEKSRTVKLENFIAALGITNIGLSAAKTISQKFNGNFHDWMDAYSHGFSWDTLDDFGATMANNLDDYLEYNYAELIKLADEMSFVAPEKNNVASNPFSGKSLCVTGKLVHHTRDSINEKIASLGAKAVGSVSKKTDYLITNEASGSSKYKKAVELNISIITEEEFLAMCNG